MPSISVSLPWACVHLPLSLQSADDAGRCSAVGRLVSAMGKLERRESIFLRASRDIETVKRCGRRMSTEVFNVLTCKMGAGPTRLGIVVGKRFGNAVRRNRVKRVFRALVRECHADLLPGHAAIVFPKREALVLPFEELKQFWRDTLKRAKLLGPRSE